MPKTGKSGRHSSRSWDPVAEWYEGWSGGRGSRHHRRLAIPAVLALIEPTAGDRILDIGCGPGALAPHIARLGAEYTGLDASRKLIAFARRHHGQHGRFVVGDAVDPQLPGGLRPGSFDAAVFLLSIQDIDPLPDAVRTAAAALRAGGRIGVLMTHPCFRIPRQSGWGRDPQRKLHYRRVDSYLSPLAVPMKRFGPEERGATRSYHRPLEAYFDAFAGAGLLVERIKEIPYGERPESGPEARAQRRANEEIPLFMGIRAVLSVDYTATITAISRTPSG